MKKLIAILLTVAIALTFTACDNKIPNEKESESVITSAEITTTIEVSTTDISTTVAPPPVLTTKIGDIIQFGCYDWRVLDVQDSNAFIITEDVIDSKPYHSEKVDITWEHSSIRNYLNGEYYNTFTADEQARIVETMVINNDNPNYGTACGNNTTDKIFLLSIDEAKSFFSGDSSRIAYNAANGEALWWWLRSPGFNSYDAAVVFIDGIVGVIGNIVSYDIGGVRPALWINL